MISEHRAKLVLENPDGCHDDDLAETILWLRYNSLKDREYESCIEMYMLFSLAARKYRTIGRIDMAIEFEKVIEGIYQTLPKDKRW